MIKQFDILKTDTNGKVEDNILTINVNDTSKLQMVYVLWTNDLKKFKYREKPAPKHIVKHILRHSPSEMINSYNDKLCKLVVSKTTGLKDIASFKKTQYMSFSEDMTEEKFIQALVKRLSTVIMEKLKDSKGDKFTKKIVDESFTDMILKELELAKFNLGIHTEALSAHCLLIYASVSNKISARIKKDLLNHLHINKSELNEILNMVINCNDNIFSRVTASYYLHVA
jgi:hypothetical protein